VIGGAGGSPVPPAAGGGDDTTTSDQALASLLTSAGAALVVTDGGSRGQTEGLLVAQDVLGTARKSENSTTTLPPALPHSPSPVPVDWLFADLVRGGLADALTAKALLGPSA
jgi:hypothetical protein